MSFFMRHDAIRTRNVSQAKNYTHGHDATQLGRQRGKELHGHGRARLHTDKQRTIHSY